MSAPPIKKKVAKGALERIADLENTIPAIVSAVNESLTNADRKTTDLAEVLEAVMQHIGVDVVRKVMDERRELRQRQRTEQAKAWLVAERTAGRLLPLEVVEEGALIIGVETDKDGNQLGTGHAQLTTEHVRPEVLVQLMGKGPGTRVETPADGDFAGGYFEVLEIYRRVQAPQAVELPPATPAPVPTAEEAVEQPVLEAAQG